MPKYLVDPILPTHEIHLVAGSSNVGKSRWLFNMLLEWEQGKPVLGLPSTPVPWCYVTADRSLASVHRTFADMGISPHAINVIPAFGQDYKNWTSIIQAVVNSKAQMAVIEAFGSFVRPPGLSHQVKFFLNEVGCMLPPTNGNRNGLTIIGVMESPKLKPGERYKDPRQRVSGVATWAHFTETIFLIERLNPDKPSDPNRVLYVSPKQGTGMERAGAFSSGGILSF